MPGTSDATISSRRRRNCRAQHPNVVGVHHLERTADGESVRMCMEFCSGGTLQKPFDRGPLPIDTVREIAMQLTLGLQSLHLRGMLHRDIKPANSLIDDHSARRHEWSALSEPKGVGRARQLAASNGEVSRAVAVSGLETFLAAQTT